MRTHTHTHTHTEKQSEREREWLLESETSGGKEGERELQDEAI